MASDSEGLRPSPDDDPFPPQEVENGFRLGRVTSGAVTPAEAGVQTGFSAAKPLDSGQGHAGMTGTPLDSVLQRNDGLMEWIPDHNRVRDPAEDTGMAVENVR